MLRIDRGRQGCAPKLPYTKKGRKIADTRLMHVEVTDTEEDVTVQLTLIEKVHYVMMRLDLAVESVLYFSA